MQKSTTADKPSLAASVAEENSKLQSLKKLRSGDMTQVNPLTPASPVS